jgi:hypothetical protein
MTFICNNMFLYEVENYPGEGSCFMAHPEQLTRAEILARRDGGIITSAPPDRRLTEADLTSLGFVTVAEPIYLLLQEYGEVY